MIRLLPGALRKSLLRLFVFLRKISLPGFQGMSVYDVLRLFLRGILDSKFTLLAAAMSYQFFFSLFPTLLLMLIVFPHFPVKGLETQVVGFLQEVVPPEGLLFVENIVKNQFQQPTNLWLLLVSILLALWGATRGILAMMKAFTRNEQGFKRRPLWEQYRTALLIFFSLGGLVLGAVLLRVLGAKAFHALRGLAWLPEGLLSTAQGAFQTSLLFLTLAFSISLLYRLGPPTVERWKMFSPGTITATLLAWAALAGLRYYFAQFGQFNELYGSLGAIILLMVWFYYISMVLLIGFELNAAIDLAAYHTQQMPAPASEPEPQALREDI